MIRSILIGFFVLTGIHCLALEKTCEISGLVLDSADQQPIEYVTVMIYSKADSSLITGGHTDISGRFAIPDVPENQEIYLKFRFIGYTELVLRDLIPTGQQLDLGTILLSKSVQNIDDVTVSAERAEVEQYVDKQVFNADKMNPSGNTALDLLREIPSILIDENNEITFRGQAGITILIDGRPINASPTHYLQSIGANQVEKIEVISNPSAKYDAEGTTGIINVLLKKNATRGFSGSTSFMYGRGVNNRYNGNLDLSFNTRKWNFFTSYFINDTKSSHDSYTLREIFSGDTVTDRLISDGTDLSSSLSQIIRAGVDFFPNDKNTLYAAATYNPGKVSIPGEIRYSNEFTGLNSTRETDNSGPINYYDVNAGWQSTLGKSVTLDFDNQYSLNEHITKEEITERINSGDVIETSTEGREYTRNLMSRLDFGIPVNDSLNFEVGAKYTMRLQNADLALSTHVNSIDIDSGFVSNFAYDQSIIAGYLIGNKTWKKWSLKIGLRAEQTMTESRIPNDGFTFTNNYFSLFPSGFVTYKTGKHTMVYANVSRRINRPQMHMVNPFIYYSDRYLVEVGDPELRPEFVYASQLGVSRYTRKLGFDAHLFFKHIEDRNRRYLRQEGELSVISYKNVRRIQASGFVISGRYIPARWLTIRFNIDTWNTRIRDEEITNNELVNTWGNATNLGFYFSFPKGWKAHLRNSYRPRHQLQQGYMMQRYALSIGISKTLLDGHLRIRLNVSDILNTLRAYFRTNDSQDYYYLGNWDWETRVAYIGINYDFAAGKKSKEKRRTKDDEGQDSTPGGF